MKGNLSKGGLLALAVFGVGCLALGIWDVQTASIAGHGHRAWLSACCSGLDLPSQRIVSLWYVVFIEVSVLAWMALTTGNLLTRLARTQTVLRRLLSQEAPLPPELHALVDEVGLQDRMTFIRSSQRLVFCYGYGRPRVCLSSGLVRALSSRQLRAVLIHERHHVANRHPLKTQVLDVAVASLFFLPILAEMRDVCVAEMELAADRAAVHGVDRKALAGALHRLLSRNMVREWQSGAVLTELNVTQARIDHLLAGTGTSWRPSLKALASTSVSLSFLCLFLMGGVG